MGLVFIEGTNSLSVDHDDVYLLSISGCAFDGGPPAPQSFGAGIDSGPHAETVAAVEQYSVEQVGLACAVESGDGYDCDRSLDGSEEFDGLFCENIFCMREEVLLSALTATMGMACSVNGVSIIQFEFELYLTV